MAYALCYRHNDKTTKILLSEDKPNGIYDMDPQYLNIDVSMETYKDWYRYTHYTIKCPVKYLAVKIGDKTYYAALWCIDDGEIESNDKKMGNVVTSHFPVPQPLTDYDWMQKVKTLQAARHRRWILYAFWRLYSDFNAEYVTDLSIRLGDKVYRVLKPIKKP